MVRLRNAAILVALAVMVSACPRHDSVLSNPYFQNGATAPMPKGIEGNWCARWNDGVPFMFNVSRKGGTDYSMTYRWQNAVSPRPEERQGTQHFDFTSDGTSFKVRGRRGTAEFARRSDGIRVTHYVEKTRYYDDNVLTALAVPCAPTVAAAE